MLRTVLIVGGVVVVGAACVGVALLNELCNYVWSIYDPSDEVGTAYER